jgi:hypothetical protein
MNCIVKYVCLVLLASVVFGNFKTDPAYALTLLSSASTADPVGVGEVSRISLEPADTDDPFCGASAKSDGTPKDKPAGAPNCTSSGNTCADTGHRSESDNSECYWCKTIKTNTTPKSFKCTCGNGKPPSEKGGTGPLGQKGVDSNGKELCE